MTKFRDDICKIGKCPNHPCKGLCPLLIYTKEGDRNSTRELLSAEIFTNDNIPTGKDYNTELAERIEDYNVRVDNIKNIPDTRSRAIAAMLSVNINKTQIAGLLHLTVQHLRRISKVSNFFLFAIIFSTI